ncbi:MAG: adenylate kinase [candidate division WOR-3 bacterium]|nr:adenylate kinase [candidate division WOR-3 bacterium]
MKIILSGPPGSGKGTQAEILAKEFDYAHFSTGDVFRDHIARKTPIGINAMQYISKGQLVPDEIVLELAKDFIKTNQKKGIIFDGFPRTIGQAQGLDRILSESNERIDLIIFIELTEVEIIKRLTARRTCRKCNAIYNLDFKPPKVAGICDICGGELYQRPDDTEEVIKDRLAVYQNQTAELKNYYKKNYPIYEIDGNLGKDKVYQEIIKLIQQKL